MSTIIAQPGPPAHPDEHPDAAARRRRDRLARATAGDMEAALAFLSMIDPEAFEIALTAVTARANEVPEGAAASSTSPFSQYRHFGSRNRTGSAHSIAWRIIQ